MGEGTAQVEVVEGVQTAPELSTGLFGEPLQEVAGVAYVVEDAARAEAGGAGEVEGFLGTGRHEPLVPGQGSGGEADRVGGVPGAPLDQVDGVAGPGGDPSDVGPGGLGRGLFRA